LPEPNRLVRAVDAAHRVAGLPSTLRLLALVRRGDLRIVGQDQNGALLFRETEVVAAVARATENRECRHINGDLRDLPEGLLTCGCCTAAPNRFWPVAEGELDPMFLCREAQGLDLARRLTATFAAAAPSHSFFARIAEVAQDAFEQHLRPPAEVIEGSANTGTKPAPTRTDDDGHRPSSYRPLELSPRATAREKPPL